MADPKDPPPLLDGLHARSGMTFFTPGDPRILSWVKEALEEGEKLNRDDPAYPQMDDAMSYILGEQLRGPRPSYLPKVVINQTKKAVRTHVAALTDIRPLFSYRTVNPKYEPQSAILNKRILAWWTNTFADLELADTIKYALAAGAGDCLVEWDPAYQSGESRFIPRDPRDTLAIRPTRSRSIQDWEGVIIRENHSPNALRAKYPEFADAIMADVASGQRWGFQTFSKFRRVMSFVTPTSTLDGLRGGTAKASKVIPEITIYRVHLKDRTVYTGTGPIVMGKPGTNWCYTVQPGEPLYPRGRLIICSENAVFYDGPNPYWHGMFPVLRLRLDPWPWVFFGLGLVHDLMPLQDAINDSTNWFLSTFSQWVNRGLVADSRAVPEGLYKRFDSRKPNWKMKVNAVLGEGFKLAEGPALPPWSLEFLKMLVMKHEDLSEMANLQQLMQLRQMPSGDTIEKYYNALTPGLRQEGRLLEAFLREAADMIKINLFQYESKAKRIMILGEQGSTLEDFDWDPDSMIPAMSTEDEGYVPELDAGLPVEKRAQFFHKLFTFYVAPNSILAMHAQEQQMKYVQLARQGYMDFWTLMEMLEVPNVGVPPPVPLPVLDWDPNEHKDAQTGIPLPPPLVVRSPTTITERLQAQQQMGIGQTVSPVGRKASGQEPPQNKTRPDGSTTITESK